MNDKEVCEIQKFSMELAQEMADNCRAEMLEFDRRTFWEMCASRGPSYGTCGDPESAAKWADSMLAEWDKRWNKENS